MFRKVLGSLAIVALFVTAACNTVSGPGEVSAPASKACIDDFRAVAITSPSESHSLYAGETVVVTWEAQHVCSSYMAEVSISYDGGQTFHSIGKKKNGVSMSWNVPALDDAQPVIRVRATDTLGELTDELALATKIRVRERQPDRGPDGELD